MSLTFLNKCQLIVLFASMGLETINSLTQSTYQIYFLFIFTYSFIQCHSKLIKQHLLQWTPHIRHQCRRTSVLSFHRCKLTLALKKWTTFKYRLQLWPSDVYKQYNSECWYSKNCLHFLKRAVTLEKEDGQLSITIFV